MSVPLDRLYHYLGDCVNHDLVIYRWAPHGSRKLEDLNQLTNYPEYQRLNAPMAIFHDQEPLDYGFYTQDQVQNQVKRVYSKWLTEHAFTDSALEYISQQHLRAMTNCDNHYDLTILVHSEQRSWQVEHYSDKGFVPVYYWSHAVIAQDWFRYAKHVELKRHAKKTFLVYNRAWSGTREYRLRFAELLIQLNLQDLCQTSVNPVEPELGIHYDYHKFKNPAWRPQTVLEDHFPINGMPSHYSADFDINDYNATDIEVVLETLFDDDRIHLTEKSLRPIAMAQPFILAATAGSLEYLRSYGFKTFGNVWDESYDLVEDPAERLIQIAELMKRISTWLPHQREHNMTQAQAIADYNRQHFFSQEFFNLVTNELKTNLTSAFNTLAHSNNYQPWLTQWTKLLQHQSVIDFLQTNQSSPTTSDIDFIIKLIQNKI